MKSDHKKAARSKKSLEITENHYSVKVKKNKSIKTTKKTLCFHIALKISIHTESTLLPSDGEHSQSAD